MSRSSSLVVALLLIATGAMGADFPVSMPLVVLKPTETQVSVETRVISVPCRLGELGDLLGSGNVVLSGQLEDINALDALDESTLLSSPRITVGFPPTPAKLVLRDAVWQLGQESAASSTLVDIYTRLDPAGQVPVDFAERCVIADLTTNNRGVIVSVRLEGVTEDAYELDYLFQYRDERLLKFHERISISKGGSKLIALASTKKEALLLVVTASPNAPVNACQLPSK